ncbi:hypothetical protein G6F62_010148 [Rhizopus arrhizus]|nr:hypothetical protein G6F62_010148 [Rhizopus arrhizus]
MEYRPLSVWTGRPRVLIAFHFPFQKGHVHSKAFAWIHPESAAQIICLEGKRDEDVHRVHKQVRIMLLCVMKLSVISEQLCGLCFMFEDWLVCKTKRWMDLRG